MKKPICQFCGEYEKCVCTWEKCALCGKSYSNFDPDESHQIFEYRGVLGCSKCIDEVRVKRDEQRQAVIETVEHTTMSQRKGEFVHNSGKYDTHNVASDGLPIVKIKEPQTLQDYENGIL